MTKLSPSGPFTITSQNDKVNSPKINACTWPNSQLIKYAVFLHFHEVRDPTLIKRQSNKWNFFRRLSIFIQSKNVNQCRIFHKIMMSKYNDLSLLINHLRSTIDQFQYWSSTYEPFLMNLRNNLAREASSMKQQSKINSQLQHKSAQESIIVDTLRIQDQKNKDELRPTDSNYPEQEMQTNLKRNDIRPIRPSVNMSMFDDKAKVGPMPSCLFEMYNQNMDLQIRNKSIGQEQCHKSFMSYFTKLNNLVNNDLWH